MKRITSNEAKHIVLTYLMGFTSASMNDDCDFYEEIPHNYILDETKLESAMNERFGMNNKEYYPDKEDIKVITNEFKKMFRQLLRQRQTCIKRYEKI
jgi:hypothetical protein